MGRDDPVSPEKSAAAELAYILQYLELNNEMEHYLTLYRLLASEVLDGMRISKELREICRNKGITLIPERMELLAGYGDYAYMKRKWKKEHRRQKRLSKEKNKTFFTSIIRDNKSAEAFPSWKDVMMRIINFGRPIWESLCRGELFVGDWMPELGRFLD